VNLGQESDVTLIHSLVQNNQVGANGGGLYIQGGITPDLGSLQLSQTRVLGNMAEGNGGGLYNQGGTLSLSEVEISDNTADFDMSGSGDGGGIYSTGAGTDRIAQSLFSHNSGINGGGYHGREAIFINSTFTGNFTTGGPGPKDGGEGGAINASTSISNIEIYNSTLTLNTALEGGGIRVDSSDTSLTLNNSIVAENTQTGVGTGGDCSDQTGDALTMTNSLGYNLDGDDTCDFNAMGDQRGENPLLNPLANNGGFTQTHTLASDSPALDGGDPAGCTDDMGPVTEDQRRVGRPQPPSNICDIGAVEMVTADLAVVKTVNAGEITLGGQVVFEVVVNNNGPGKAQDVLLEDNLPLGLAFVSANPSQGSCLESAGILTCDLGTLASGEMITLVLTLSANQEGSFTNTATATFPDLDPDPDNNTDDVDFIIVPNGGNGGGGCSFHNPGGSPSHWLLASFIFLLLVGALLRHRANRVR